MDARVAGEKTRAFRELGESLGWSIERIPVDEPPLY